MPPEQASAGTFKVLIHNASGEGLLSFHVLLIHSTKRLRSTGTQGAQLGSQIRNFHFTPDTPLIPLFKQVLSSGWFPFIFRDQDVTYSASKSICLLLDILNFFTLQL